MTNLAALLENLRRPKILIRAARSGVNGFRRERDLKRIFPTTRMDGGRNAIVPLMAEEQRLEECRVTGNATYSIQRHVIVLTAIMAEARAFSELVNPVTGRRSDDLDIAA